MASIIEFRKRIEQQKGKRDLIKLSIDNRNVKIKELKKHQRWTEKALLIVQEVAQKTQQQLQYHLSGLATRCLETVFDDPYELRVEFIQQRNKTEAEIKLIKGNQEAFKTGFGVRDIISFGLRAALWSIKQPKVRNVLLLDEPFRHLKDPTKKMQNRARTIMKELSKQLNLQIIIIDHDPAITEGADKIFQL